MGTRTPDLYRVKVDLASLINRLKTGLSDPWTKLIACQSGAWVIRRGQGTGFKQGYALGGPAAALEDLIASVAIIIFG